MRSLPTYFLFLFLSSLTPSPLQSLLSIHIGFSASKYLYLRSLTFALPYVWNALLPDLHVSASHTSFKYKFKYNCKEVTTLVKAPFLLTLNVICIFYLITSWNLKRLKAPWRCRLCFIHFSIPLPRMLAACVYLVSNNYFLIDCINGLFAF